MAEVTKNVPEQKTSTSSADTSKSKSNSSNSLKQSKIGFLPRKKVIPSFVKADSATAEKKPHDSNTNDTSKNSSEKTVKKTSKPDIVKNSSSSKSGKPEENGGIKQNGKSSTPSKKSSDSDKDDLPLVKLKLDRVKCSDISKSSKPKTPKKDSGIDKHGKHESKSKPSTPVKKSATPVKKPSSTSKKTSEHVNDKKDSSGKALPSSSSSSAKKPIDNNSSLVTSTANVPTGNQSSKGRLSSSVKGQRSCPVEITSSDDDDEMPLSQIRKKCTPVKSDNADKNSTAVNILMANQRPKTTQKTGKLDQTVQALHNRQVNGPIHNAMKNMSGAAGKPAPPPLHPVPTKNIIIAIDMDPQKWKSLSPQEQTRIIEHKKELARKHLIAQSKAPSNQSRLIPNHRHLAPQVMNVHHKLAPHMVASNAFPTKANLIISPTHPNAKQYVTAPRATIPHNSYYSPRTPNFPSQMSPRIGSHVGPHIGPMQQSQQFNNFNFTQFNVKQEESTMTDLKPLPLTKKIPMPPGFPNECFGDIAMIVEFVNTFKKFLVHTVPLDAVTLMIGVSPGGDKADVVSHILLLFLKVLLSNEDYKVRGLKMELADLPLTEFTVSFLVCQLMKSQLETKKRQRKEKEFAEKAAKAAEKVADLIPMSEPNAEDSDPDDNFDAALFISDSDDDDGEKKKKKKKKKEDAEKKPDIDPLETELTIISKQLESKEFWQLATVNQIRVLTFLIDLILDSDDISDYYDEIAEEKSKAYRDIEDQRKKKAKLRMESAVVTLDQFAKKMPNDKTSEKEEKDKDKKKEEDKDKDKEKNGDSEKDKEEDKKEPEKPPDPYAGMTQRQREAIRSEHERNEEKKREKEWQDAELARIDYEKSSAKFTSVVALLKRCMRVEPLGEDRFHRLYWFFTNGIPGLYVSNCCVGTILSPIEGEKPKESWSYYNKEEDINQLLCSLTVRGLREEKLKSRIRDEHLAISASIKEIKEIDMYKMIRRSQNVDKPEEVKDIEKPKEEEKASSAGTEKKSEAEGKKEEKMEVDGEKDEKNKDGEKKDGDDHKVDGETKNVDGKEVDSKQKQNDAEKKVSIDNEKKTELNEKKDENDGNPKSEVSEEKKARVDSDKVIDADKKEQNGTDEKKTQDNVDKDSEKKLNSGTDSEKKKDLDDDDDEKIMSLIHKNVEDDRPYDAHKASIEALKADIIESANRIVHGSLGELTDLDFWTERVSSVNTVEGLKEFVLQIQSCIVPKFFLTPFKATTAADISKDWCNWVEKCMTLSTMHMLYGLLENSIKWESSSEKMRCKVCRRRKGTEQIQQIIVCDGCHLGYHSHCLRPPLSYIPEGIWKCPSCEPKGEAPSNKSGRSYRASKQGKEVVSGEEEEDEDKEEEEEEETDHEEVCHECESDGTLILCDTCPLSFHLECHKPPLHHAPRGNWSCYECTSSRSKRGGRNNSKNKKATGKQGREPRSKYVDYSDDYDMESENEASSSDEFVSAKKGKKASQGRPKKNASAKKNPPRKRRAVRNMEESTEDDGSDYDDESSESSEQEDAAPKGRRAKKTASAKIVADKKPTKTQRKKKPVSDAEEDEEDKSTRPSKGKKKKRVISDEEEEDDNDKITADNLSEKIQKFNYKKRGSKTTQNDEENNNSKTKKTNFKKKGRKRTKLDNGEDDNNSSNNSNSGGEEWEITHISPTLGNKRPCYAKDGLRKKEKEANEKKQKASTDSSPEKSGEESGEEKTDTEKNGDEGQLDSDNVDDGQKEEPGDEKGETAKKQEVLRNLSSADRTFRQAGRNSRRCNYEMQACRNILASLRKHKDAWAFLLPVNVKQAPDYLTIIEKPMDFSLVLKNLDDFLYDDALQFVDDVKLVFENSKKYNADTSIVGEAGVRLHKEFQELLKVHLPEVHATLQT